MFVKCLFRVLNASLLCHICCALESFLLCRLAILPHTPHSLQVMQFGFYILVLLNRKAVKIKHGKLWFLLSCMVYVLAFLVHFIYLLKIRTLVIRLHALIPRKWRAVVGVAVASFVSFISTPHGQPLRHCVASCVRSFIIVLFYYLNYHFESWHKKESCVTSHQWWWWLFYSDLIVLYLFTARARVWGLHWIWNFFNINKLFL